MSHFPFVQDKILCSNLDIAFEHIVDLLTLSESDSYKNKKALVSSLRKTIIIHTASIIEALLLWKLELQGNLEKEKLINEWKYSDIRVLYKVSDLEEVVAGRRKKKGKNIKHLDFLRITDLCVKYKIIKSDKVRKDIDKVRELRNRQHIGGLVELEREYTKADLEFCFKVANIVKKQMSTN